MTALLATVADDLDNLEVQNFVHNLGVHAVSYLGNMEVQHRTDHLMGVTMLGLVYMDVQHSIDHLMTIEVMVQHGNLLVEHSIDPSVVALTAAATAMATALVVEQRNMKHLEVQTSSDYYKEEAGQMMASIEESNVGCLTI